MSRRKETRRKTDFRQSSEGTRLAHSASDNARLDSFRGWRGQNDKEALVNAGFYYLGEEDAVQCFCCKTVIKNWAKEMDPVIEHVKHAPYCKYLTQLIPVGDLAEMKDQLFGITKMRAPTEGVVNWPCNKFTGERVEEEEVHDAMYVRAPQQSVEQGIERHTDNQESDRDAIQSVEQNIERHTNTQESDRDAIQSVDLFFEGSDAEVKHVQMDASGHGKEEAEERPNPDIGLPQENTPPRGELNQDAGTHEENGDDNIDRMMQSTAAQNVLQTGYGTEDDVRNAIIDLRRNGKQDFNGEDIMRLLSETESYSTN